MRGDILVAYRMNPSCQMEAVGKASFGNFVGDKNMEVEIFEGELKVGDIVINGKI